MTLTFHSFILGKTILRSYKFDDIETWNQPKRTVGCFNNYFSIKHIKTRMRPQIGYEPIIRKKTVFLPG